jgi:hypothetical protein
MPLDLGHDAARLWRMAARKKPARSPIASDPQRALIDRSLVMGVPMNQISKRFGYSVPAISRYRDRMPQQLKAAIVAAALRPKEADLDKLRIEESEGILGNLAHQRARLLLCQDECMEAGAATQVGYLANIIHKNIELAGKYLGLFAQHHVSTSINILLSEDYLRLRQALVLALRPFPEARRAVADALQQIEGEVARKILAAKMAAEPSGVLIEQKASDSAPPFPPITRPGNGAAGDI